MSGEISISVDLTSWKTRFNNSVKQTTTAIDYTVKKVAERLYKKVIEYTPVGDPKLWHPPYWPKGYTPGQLKNSWKIEYISNYDIKISNDQPYASRVEFGWSTQAPEGMMRRAALLYPILTDRTAAEYKV